MSAKEVVSRDLLSDKEVVSRDLLSAKEVVSRDLLAFYLINCEPSYAPDKEHSKLFHSYETY